MTVIQLGQPVAGLARSVQAVAANGIAIAFPEPSDKAFKLSDVIELDLQRIGVDQCAVNIATGDVFTLNIPANDVHDMEIARRARR